MSSALDIKWDINSSNIPKSGVSVEKSIFFLKKLHAEYVWDIVHLEGNPYTFLEVQTLLDGTTIGGHSLSDQTQVLNQSTSLKELSDTIKSGNVKIDRTLALRYHNLVAKEEALEWGCFRNGQVFISGTDYRPPVAEDLNIIFDNGLKQILQIENAFERALIYYFFGSLNQFFYDGNKRTSRLIMNTILMSNGYYYLSVPGKRKEEFDSTMVDFYNTKNATAGIEFMLSCYRDFGV